MTTMISEVYTALRKVGVPEDDGKAAAEALSSESTVTRRDVQRLEREIKVEMSKLNPSS